MNINNEMRMAVARELTKRIYKPKLEELDAKITAGNITHTAESLVPEVMRKCSFKRLDKYRQGDVPEIRRLTIELNSRHAPERYTGPTHRGNYREGSIEADAASLYATLCRCHKCTKDGGSFLVQPAITPVRIPFDLYDSWGRYGIQDAFAAGSRMKNSEQDGQYAILVVGSIQDRDFKETRNRLLLRMWMQYCKLHALLKEAMDFHLSIFNQLKPFRTLSKLQEGWPEIVNDFLTINNVTDKDKQVSTIVRDPEERSHINSLLRATKAAAKKQATA